MKRVLLECVALFVLAVLVGVSSYPQTLVKVREIAPLLDTNIQRIHSADIRYIVREIPTERAQRLLQEISQNPSAFPPVAIVAAKAFATRKVLSVRSRFQGERFRHDYSEEQSLGETTSRKSVSQGFDGSMGWIYEKERRSGSLQKEKDVVSFYQDPRFPYMMFDYSTPWSSWLETQIQKGFLRPDAVVKRVSGLLVFDVPTDADKTHVQRMYVDPAQGYLVKRIENFSNGRLRTKEEAVEVAEVAPSVYFPIKQVSIDYDMTGAEISRCYRQVTDIRVNVSIPNNVFVPDFPPGTRVGDYIHNRTYIVTTPLWTFRRTLIALLVIGLLIAFWWWRYRHLAQRTRA